MTHLISLIREALRPDQDEPAVHFHAAAGHPEVCHDERCARPHLELHCAGIGLALVRGATLALQARQSRGGFSFEESPDITGQGGRETDPGKPAGKCHRNDTADGRGARARRHRQG